jgi:serine/threonine protein kinase
MLHRDIKPGNLLRSLSGVTKIGDFGLVTDDIILGYGSIAGYQDHLAPEVWNMGTARASSQTFGRSG